MRNKIFLAFFLLLAVIKVQAQVTVTSSDSISCTQTCTILTAHVTGDNPVSSGIHVDDHYTDTTCPIGFNFNFYGNTYSRCLIGPNGTLSFSLADSGMFTDWTISGPLLGNPTVLNSICGPWCDIDISPSPPTSGTISYSTDGVAPYRKYIVSFCATHMFSCTSQITTTQIILYETTNIIEVHIASKPVCAGWNGGYAIIGVQNAAGSSATAAPGRDFPNVYTCTNEAWRFSPDASAANYTVASIPYAPVPLASSAVYWYNATTGAFIGTGLTQSVCPTGTTTYKAGALSCADTSFGYYTVVPSGTISVSHTETAPSTCGGNNGQIVLGGLTPGITVTVNYSLNGVAQPPLTLTASVSGTITLSGLIAGSYSNLIVTSGVCSSLPLNITLNPAPITITAATAQPSVCGYSDAKIILSGYIPSTSYTITYTLNGVALPSAVYTSSASGQVILTGLQGGTGNVYSNIVSTGGPCPPTTVAGPITIANPAPPVVTVDSALVKTCVGVPVQLHAYAAPSTITEFYSWSPITDLNNAGIANPIVTPSAAGNVVYVVTGNPSPAVAECAYTATVTVHAVGDFAITTPTDTICLLTPRVSVPVTISGSTELAYSWTPTTGVVTATSMNPVITPTTNGTFVYVVTGSYAHCPDFVHTYTLRVDTPARGIYVTDTICLGMTGVVDVTVPGTSLYHYQWISSPTGVNFSNDTIPNPVFNATAYGAYILQAYVHPDAPGCGIYDTVQLLVLPNSINIHPTDTIICAGQVVPVSGTIGYNWLFHYQWIPTTGIASDTVLNTTIVTDTSALYTVTASFPGCPDIHATLNLDLQPIPSVYIGGNRPLCQFDTLHINAHVTPSWYSGYSYSWSPATHLDNTTTSTVVYTGDSAVTTNVIVTVTTSAGCTAQDSALITVGPGNFAGADASADYCPHDSKTVNITPAGGGNTYQWFPSMYVSDSLSGTPTLSPITTQTYSVVVTSPGGCKDTVYYTATVFPAAVIELGDSLTLYPGESYAINPMTNCTSFLWFPTTGLDNPFISNPTATPDVSTTYIVTGTTEHGCVAKDTISIYVDPESILAMPNAFTPGGEGNTTFKIFLRGIATLNYFRVYNRWGNLMFETKNMSEGWNGAYKGEPQDMGVYVYDIQAVTSTGKVFHKSGNVTLLR